MVKEASSDLYSLILERIFFKHFHDGRTSIWKRDELLEAANELDVRAPKNLGDLIYAFRYRRTLPESIRAAAPEGIQWIIRGKGRAEYQFELVKQQVRIIPNPSLACIKIPDATPQIIRSSALGDEQALLALVRYNRLIDIFLGITTYSLQNHLRTTAPGIGQVEIDEIYVGVDGGGRQYILPVQAKGGKDEIGVTQAEQDLAVCADRWPSMIARPVAAQFADDGLIALFELALQDGELRIRREEHYQLVPSEQITPEDLQAYRLNR